jgi:hypothetical protein
MGDSQHPLVGSKSDTTGRMAWLENYCRAQPLARFLTANAALRYELEDNGQ